MKKLLFTTLFALVSLGLYAQNADEEAIKKVCIAQHDAWIQRDTHSRKNDSLNLF